MEPIKKSATLWPQRLFEIADAKKSVSYHHKSYFAHHYPGGGSAAAEKSGFSDLFSELDVFRHKDAPDLIFQPQKDSSSGYATRAPALSAKSTCGQFTVLNCYNETPDTKTFRLAKLDGDAVDYLPGQYITLTAMIGGKEYKRSYSLASTPSHPGIIDITVKRDPKGGVVSNWLNDNLKTGDSLHLKGPFGKFTCARETPEKILFLAAGSGVVPIMSMLRWLAGTEKKADIALLLSFRSYNDIIYRRELELIASRHANIRLFITITQEPDVKYHWPGLKGRINKNILAALTPDLPERAVYLCGPDGFISDCNRYLHELGHPESRLFCESFCIDNLNRSVQQSNTSLSPPTMANGNYHVKFARSGLQITTDGRINLLVLAEKSGVKIGHECRTGSCGECMVKCLEGKVDLAYQAEIDDIDRKKGWVYACCAYPASNVSLDI